MLKFPGYLETIQSLSQLFSSVVVVQMQPQAICKCMGTAIFQQIKAFFQ